MCLWVATNTNFSPILPNSISSPAWVFHSISNLYYFFITNALVSRQVGTIRPPIIYNKKVSAFRNYLSLIINPAMPLVGNHRCSEEINLSPRWGFWQKIYNLILPTLNADGIKYRVLSSVKSARLVENKSSCIWSSVGTTEKQATKNLPNTCGEGTNRGEGTKRK